MIILIELSNQPLRYRLYFVFKVTCDVCNIIVMVQSAGIIRAVDPIQKVFYVLTPVPLEILRKDVNVFLKGVLEIPPCIITNQVNLR